MKKIFYALISVLPLFITGCFSDFGIKDTGMEHWILERSQTALSSDSLSLNTRDFLLREGIFKEYQENPEEILETLSQELFNTKDRKLLYSLIELTFLHAKESSEPDKSAYYYLSACIYSYMYLFKSHYFNETPSPFEPEYLFACRFYNYSAAELFKYMQTKKLLFAGNINMPFLNGRVKFTSPINHLPKKLTDFRKFKICYEYTPFGFQSLSRQSGLGVPLVGVGVADISRENEDDSINISSMAYPTTLFIKFEIKDSEQFAAKMEYFDTMETEYIKFKDKKVPLEVDFSTYLGWILRGGAKYNPIEAMIDSSVINKSQGLSMLTPYDKNKIPIVFIHGVLSQPRTWVQAINTLLMNNKIRTNYQFWLFAYPTSNPVVISAWELRRVLKRAKARYDAENESKYFNHMVLIAHSMGGLVAKQMVTDSGDVYLNSFTNGKPLNEFNLDKKEEKFVSDVLKFKPLPFIDTVVFISVPHRGSYMTRWWVASLAAKLVYLPKKVAKDIYSIHKKVLTKTGLLKDNQEIKINTGVDNLDPDNKFIKMSSKLPIDPKVKYYSIIGNEKTANIPGGTDGVVSYESAHLDGAQSEIIVKSGHGAHRNPIAIKEIKRILLKHLEEVEKKQRKNNLESTQKIKQTTKEQ
jgi:triacylglycerol esterase/lipase EstA (alpha/beta hydrolase family)